MFIVHGCFPLSLVEFVTWYHCDNIIWQVGAHGLLPGQGHWGWAGEKTWYFDPELFQQGIKQLIQKFDKRAWMVLGANSFFSPKILEIYFNYPTEVIQTCFPIHIDSIVFFYHLTLFDVRNFWPWKAWLDWVISGPINKCFPNHPHDYDHHYISIWQCFKLKMIDKSVFAVLGSVVAARPYFTLGSFPCSVLVSGHHNNNDG